MGNAPRCNINFAAMAAVLVATRAFLIIALCCRLCAAPAPSAQEQTVLDMLRARAQARWAHTPEVSAAAAEMEKTQHAALADLTRERFVYVRMNPAAGLGNRLVAMVSGLLLARATERGFLLDWQEYKEPLTHRSKEVSSFLTRIHTSNLTRLHAFTHSRH